MTIQSDTSQSNVFPLDQMWKLWEPLHQQSKENSPSGSVQIEDQLNRVTLDEDDKPFKYDVPEGYGTSAHQGFRLGTSPAFDTPIPWRSAAHAIRMMKISVYRDVIKLYSEDSDDTTFNKLWKESHSPDHDKFDLAFRMKRASEEKEAATRKYAAGNWFGAMYTYALAWGCMLPHDYEVLPRSHPSRIGQGKLDCALFSNISAMAKVGSEDPKTTNPLMSRLADVGLRACIIVTSSKEVVTVGIMRKACHRASAILSKVTNVSGTEADATHRYYKEQAAVLDGLSAEMMFVDVANTKKLKRKMPCMDPGCAECKDRY